MDEIRKYVPKNFTTYYEPFLGGGAVFLELQPKHFVVNDINPELINVYQTTKNNVDLLIATLKTFKNESDSYYEIRELDRFPLFNTMSNIEKAARIIYLNKTCFNGLFRVNSQGQFNVPFGSYKNPDIINEITLRAVSRYLNENSGSFLNGDFADAVKEAKKGCFIYLDPPYDPVSDSSSFTGYTLDGFGKRQQTRLKAVCDDLDNRGCKFLVSNSSTDFIRDLYRDYKIERVQATRSINSVAAGRGKVDELLIRNYE